MTAARCGCSACPQALGASNTAPGDGFCEFCDRHCFPVADVCGRAQRIAMTIETRTRLHAPGAAARRVRPLEQALHEIVDRHGEQAVDAAVRWAVQRVAKWLR